MGNALAEAQYLIALRIESDPDLQVVLVASAGEDPDESCGDTSVWPGLLASDCDIITLGQFSQTKGTLEGASPGQQGETLPFDCALIFKS